MGAQPPKVSANTATAGEVNLFVDRAVGLKKMDSQPKEKYIASPSGLSDRTSLLGLITSLRLRYLTYKLFSQTLTTKCAI